MSGGMGWGAAAGAASSIGSSFIQNAGNSNRQKKQNRFNYEMWRQTNEYNSPVQQRKRLKEAGLNPHLVYGGSPSQVAGKADMLRGEPPQPFVFDNPANSISKFANFKQQEAQTDNLRSQNTVILQEAALKAAQTAKTGMDTAKTSFDYSLAKKLEKNSLQAADANVRKMEQQVLGEELNNRFKSESMKDRVLEAFYRAQHVNAQLTGQERLNELRRLEVNLKKMGIEKGDNLFMRILGVLYNKYEDRVWSGDLLNFKD